jgi:hypothetical protein
MKSLCRHAEELLGASETHRAAALKEYGTWLDEMLDVLDAQGSYEARADCRIM